MLHYICFGLQGSVYKTYLLSRDGFPYPYILIIFRILYLDNPTAWIVTKGPDVFAYLLCKVRPCTIVGFQESEPTFHHFLQTGGSPWRFRIQTAGYFQKRSHHHLALAAHFVHVACSVVCVRSAAALGFVFI